MKRIVLIAFCLLLCFLVGCNGRYKTVDIEEVVSASVWTHNGQYELNAEELAEFIKLYNSSEYKGKATGEGGTPEFGASVELEGGKQLIVNDYGYGNIHFEAFNDGEKGFYLDNEELLSFITQLCENNITVIYKQTRTIRT